VFLSAAEMLEAAGQDSSDDTDEKEAINLIPVQPEEPAVPVNLNQDIAEISETTGEALLLIAERAEEIKIEDDSCDNGDDEGNQDEPVKPDL